MQSTEQNPGYITALHPVTQLIETEAGFVLYVHGRSWIVSQDRAKAEELQMTIDLACGDSDIEFVKH